ncbi:MAG TPA: autotransporter domain-containing protein [Rhizomicrobium sp.]|nr:autotransporter domain-containing protein [Rhizomicrobium sp.]
MSKRALMLTVAAAALLSRPVLGDDFTDIKTKVTQQIKTSTAANGSPGDILIESNGSVVVTTAGPAVEIDSANTVTNNGTISNIGTTSAIGVQMDATAGGNGPGASATAFDSTGVLDLSGSSGGLKTAILVGIANGDASGIFNGGINLEGGSSVVVTGDNAVAVDIGSNTTLNGAINFGGSVKLSGGTSLTGLLIGTSDTATANVVGDVTFGAGSIMSLTGDGSYGVHINPNSVLTGNLDVAGSIIMAPTNAKSTSDGSTVGIWIDNNTAGDAVTGNFLVDKGGAVTATGANSQGVVLLGAIGGNFTNSGNITAVGTTAPLSSGNPVSGSALVIANDIAGGILNNGPTNANDTTTPANITGNGLLPVLLISPTADGATAAGDINIGANPGLPEGDYGFINRGLISASPANPDQAAAIAVSVQGAGSFNAFIDNGFFSSGTIAAATTGDDKQLSAESATGIFIGGTPGAGGGVVPVLFNSNQNSATPGTISASYSGTILGGSAFAIHISRGGVLNSIVNQGVIAASATNTDTTLSNGSATTCGTATALTACAIWDESGTLTQVTNSGTISALATTLDDNSQVAIAIDMSAATQNTTIDNSGTINGDVNLGNAADFVHVHGDANRTAGISGDINFGGTGNAGGADDSLEIDDHAFVIGNITDRAGGQLDVLLNPGGSLTEINDSIDLDKRFEVHNLTVGAGATLGLTLSQTYNLAANPTAGGIVTASGQVLLDPQAIVSLPFQSFLSGQTPGEASQFILIDAPLDELQLSLSALQNQICTAVPFLFENSDQECLRVNDTADRSQLVLSLTPKSAEEIGLTGYALRMFPVANLALANDSQLGAAVINAGLPVDGVPLTQDQGQTLYQRVYSQFAPNVTGASRALAIAITDQTSGPVAARQRELRMYAGQLGDTTLWGQEFNLSLNQDANAGTIGYRDTGLGFVLGLDGGNPADGRYGAAISFYSGNINEKQPQDSSTDSQWALLTGYTDWRGRGLFLDTQLSVGVGQLDGRRHLDVDEITRTAEGKRDTLLGAIGATTGVIMTTGSTIFTPMVSLDGMWMKENGYTEHGGGDPNGGDGFDLSVNSIYYDSARAFAGADVRQDIDLGDFYLQPEARAGYRYDFLANAPKVGASFASTPGTDFSLTGPDPAKGNVVLGGSLSATTGAWSIGLHYDYLRGDDKSVSQAGTITLVGRI